MDAPTSIGEAGAVQLYWRVVLINGALLCAATLALALGPFSVSREPTLSQVLVLLVGLAATLVANAALLRSSLAPVDRVVREMATVDLLEPADRIPAPPSGPGARLVSGYSAMLDRLETERGASTARAVAAQEAERHRIARELHDEVGQNLTVVLLGLKQLERRSPDDLREEMALLRERTRAGLDDVRRVARQLRPEVLDDLGLQSALASLTADLAAHSTARVRRTIAPGLPTLSVDRELVVYRIAQEALTNAARHAAAEHVDLVLGGDGERVVLEVTDDGRGFDTTVAGSGLRGMRERALLVDGRLSLTSSAGRGSTVRLSLPVGPPATPTTPGTP